jgi:hypothetical protein
VNILKIKKKISSIRLLLKMQILNKVKVVRIMATKFQNQVLISRKIRKEGGKVRRIQIKRSKLPSSLLLFNREILDTERLFSLIKS